MLVESFDSLLVFADDWGRHPSSCQHLVRELLPEHPVVWVNTIGTRLPGFSLSTLRRGFGKLRQWSKPRAEPTHLPKNLQVLNPKMWPSFRTGWAKWLNRNLLVRQIEPALGDRPVAVTTLPIVADLMGRLPVAGWVYYCVDDFSKWPGLDQGTLEAMERYVVDRADAIFTVSETLQDRLRLMGRDSELLTHGVDLDFWSEGDAPCRAVVGLEPPLFVFWGVLDQRMDLSFLRRLSDDMDSGTILLAGPEDNPDPELSRIARVVRVGALPFEDLPALGQAADVLIMPYADLPVTRAMQPLKLKEYLATGRPVVVRDLPANREWSHSLDMAHSPEEFSGMVRQRAREGVTEAQVRNRGRLVAESWKAKAQRFRATIKVTGGPRSVAESIG